MFMRMAERFKQVQVAKRVNLFSNSIIKKNYTICIFLLFGLFISIFLLHNGLRNSKGLTQLIGGVRTCFNRVGQSYTANLLRHTEYGAKFHAVTEQCLGDVGILFEDAYGNTLGNMMKDFNSLSTEVHWFHEKLSMRSSNLGPYFEKIENISLSIIRKIETQILSIEKEIVILRNIAIGLSAMITYLMLLGWSKDRRLKKINLKREEEALKILHNTKRLKENNLYLIKEMLLLNGFNNCFKLMDSFKITREEKAEDMKIDDKESPLLSSDYININLLLSNMLNAFSHYFFKYKILLDLDEVEDIWIKGDKEVLEQIIFSMVNYAIKKDKEENDGKKIKIKLSKKSDAALLKISDIKLSSLKDSEKKEKDLPVEMTICRELIKDFDGEISFEDIIENNQIKGSSVEIVLKGIQPSLPVAHVKRVVSVKKGKKKEILKELGNM